jgi:outer membrane immunogenic protein
MAEMKTMVVAAALVLWGSGETLAADVSEIAPAGFVWSGGYVGLQAGHAWSQSHFMRSYGTYSDPDPDGFFGGAYAGYNRQLQNNVVLGIDADINFTGIDGKADALFADGTSDLDHALVSNVKWNGALRARLGYSMDRFMPYIAGGLSAARYEFTLRHMDGSDHTPIRGTWTGWNLGAGLEYAVTEKFLLRTEYRYTDYGSQEFGTTWFGEQRIKGSLKSHDVRLGLAYKF